MRLVERVHRVLQCLLEARVKAEQGLHPCEFRLHDGHCITGVPGLAYLESGVVQLWTLLGCSWLNYIRFETWDGVRARLDEIAQDV